jgi:transposase
MGKKYRHYTDELRREAVRLALESGNRIPKVARQLGMPSGTLRHWVAEAMESTSDSGRDTTAGVNEETEIARLRAELDRVKLERDFLKKAAAFFAKNQS